MDIYIFSILHIRAFIHISTNIHFFGKMLPLMYSRDRKTNSLIFTYRYRKILTHNFNIFTYAHINISRNRNFCIETSTFFANLGIFRMEYRLFERFLCVCVRERETGRERERGGGIVRVCIFVHVCVRVRMCFFVFLFGYEYIYIFM